MRFLSRESKFAEKEYNQYPNKLNKTTLINNGILELNSSFGGFIDVNGIDAVIKTAGNFSNSISSKEASTFTKFHDKLPEAATTFTITTKTIGLLTQNQSDSCLKKELNKDLYYFSIDKTDTFAWLENKISVACSSDINSLGKNTLKAQISLSLSPNENYFDLNTIEWRIVSQKVADPICVLLKIRPFQETAIKRRLLQLLMQILVSLF